MSKALESHKPFIILMFGFQISVHFLGSPDTCGPSIVLVSGSGYIIFPKCMAGILFSVTMVNLICKNAERKIE